MRGEVEMTREAGSGQGIGTQAIGKYNVPDWGQKKSIWRRDVVRDTGQGGNAGRAMGIK